MPEKVKIVLTILIVFFIALIGAVGCGQLLQKTEPEKLAVIQHDPYVFVANYNSQNISVINALKGTVETTIKLTESPWSVKFNKNQNKWYVATKYSILVIRNTDLTIEASISVPGMSLAGIVLNAEGTYAYVVDAALEDVSFMDLAKNAAEKRVNVGTTPVWIDIAKDQRKLYVTNFYTNNVSVINIANGSLEANINVGSHPYGLAVNPNTGKIYIANTASNFISIIDPATNDVDNSIPFSFSPSWISISSGANKIYVADNDSNNIYVLDIDSFAVKSTIGLSSRPTCMSFNAAKTRLYISHAGDDIVSIINTQTESIEAIVSVGDRPVGLCYEE